MDEKNSLTEAETTENTQPEVKVAVASPTHKAVKKKSTIAK